MNGAGWKETVDGWLRTGEAELSWVAPQVALRSRGGAHLPHQKEDPAPQQDGGEAGCQQVLRAQPWSRGWSALFSMQLKVPGFLSAQA